MEERLEANDTMEILTDPRSGDAFVTVGICDLGPYARSPEFLHGLVESNFFRTDLSGFAFAVPAGSGRLVIQERLAASDLADASARALYREKAAAIFVRATDIVEMLKARADAAAKEVAK